MASHHPAFELLSDREIPEFRARGLLFRHKATGCEVYRLVSEDEENSFAFAFRTPPPDSSGVAHIVEHSVLCGSERYPVKDAFLVMARRSLATFLNAWTYPDKTVYPAASAAPADYFNLMSVYGDAVFFPRLSEDTFLQEAHHLELSEEGSLDVKGVVYNEMRGDYSSAESLAATAAATSLFTPGHPYSFDSGGDPEAIPSLSYEAFKEFWAACYHPSNCRIFLHGNIDTERQLAFLEERFLGRAEPGKRFAARKPSPEIPFEPPFAAPRRLEVPCPASEGSEGATTIIVNWLSRPAADAAEALALEVLSEILLGHDGAPLSVALRDSGLGEDLSPQSGLDSSYRQAIFTAGLRGARRGDEGKIEELVVATVRALAAESFKAEALEAALHSIAFANKEIRRGSGTYGLRLMNRALRGWLHGAHPEESLSFERPLAVLKESLAAEPRYLEGLALALVADNPHRSTVTVYPDPGLFERREAERRAALAARAASLTKAELERVGERAARLAEEQDRADPPELLALLPRLEVKDIPRTIDIVPRERASVLGRPASLHPLFTNGIVYLDLAFPLDGLPREAYLWLPLLSRFIAGAGLPGLPYDRVAERLARTAGGFGASLDSGSPLRRAADGRVEALPVASYAIFRLKALAEKFPAALELALSLLTGADVSDGKRVADILAELGNDVLSALVPAGNSFALARAGAPLSEALALEELWRGTSQLQFLRSLREGPAGTEAAVVAAEAAGAAAGEAGLAAAAGSDEVAGPPAAAVEEAQAVLDALRRSIVGRSGLRINLTAGREDLPAALAALEAALPALPEEGAPPPASGRPLDPAAMSEGYVIPSQVGFAAAALASSRLGGPRYAQESVLAHYLTTGPLWDELRVRRGAYGASCYAEPLEGTFLFSTYRDPSPAESLSFFGEALSRASAGLSAEAAEEAVVGAAGRDLKPLLPEERGFADWKRELYGIDDAMRREKREALLSTGKKELEAAAARLAASYAEASSVLISRAEDVQLLHSRRGDTRIVELPL